MTLILFSAFITGLAGNAHCLGMCGSLHVALGLNSAKKRFFLFYQLGRICGYGLLGFFFCGLFILLGFRPSVLSSQIIRLILSAILFLIGLQMLFQFNILRFLESQGLKFWRPLQHFIHSFLPLRSQSEAFLLGLLWCLLPCSLIYSALLLAIASANVLFAFLIMFVFGLGTLPALLFSQIFSKYFIQLIKPKYIQIVLGLFMLISAFLTAKFS